MSSDFTLIAVGSVVFLLTLGGVHEIGYQRGSKVEAALAKTRADNIDLQHQRELKLANDRERGLELALKTQLAQRDADHQKEMDLEKNRFARHVAGLRSGAVRVSVPVVRAGDAVGTAAAGTDATAAGRDPETRAELAPQAAIDLAAIASDGNAAILDLNSCIDRYNTVRATVNAATAPSDVQAQ